VSKIFTFLVQNSNNPTLKSVFMFRGCSWSRFKVPSDVRLRRWQRSQPLCHQDFSTNNCDILVRLLLLSYHFYGVMESCLLIRVAELG